MTLSLAIDRDAFSIITIADRGVRSPAWHDRMRWPSAGDSHLALSLDRDSQRSIWAAQLDSAVMAADRAVLLVAEGIGCFATAWWARLSPAHYVSRVAGAVLFDPGPEPVGEHGRPFAAPPVRLPFPSVVLAGADDDTRSLAHGWGSRMIAGTRQRDGDQPAWRTAQRLMRRMTAGFVERDVERMMAIRSGLR